MSFILLLSHVYHQYFLACHTPIVDAIRPITNLILLSVLHIFPILTRSEPDLHDITTRSKKPVENSA